MKVLNILFASTLLLFSGFNYAGEMGNNCTTGLSEGVLFKTNCSVSEVYKGKTYCFSGQAAKDEFLKNPEETANKAKAFYDKSDNGKDTRDKNSMNQMEAMPIHDKVVEVEREKISQADALAQINSKTCDLSNKDAGY